MSAVPTAEPEKVLTMPELYEFKTVTASIAHDIHKALLGDLRKSYRIALLEMLRRKKEQQGNANCVLLPYYVGNVSHDQMVEEMNTILAHFTGLRTFLLDQLLPLLIKAGETERGRSLVLAVEESLERDMTDVFQRTVTAATEAGIVLSWTDYLGFTYRLNPSSDSNDEG